MRAKQHKDKLHSCSPPKLHIERWKDALNKQLRESNPSFASTKLEDRWLLVSPLRSLNFSCPSRPSRPSCSACTIVLASLSSFLCPLFPPRPLFPRWLRCPVLVFAHWAKARRPRRRRMGA